MTTLTHNLLLADDDTDDCNFFQEALEELPFSTTLTTVHDGVQLMRFLTTIPMLPDVLFLDLNMPLKTGVECLAEIKLHEKLKHLPVIIYSTSLDPEVVNILWEKGALHYIRKPGDFSKLKKVISEALTCTLKNNEVKLLKENFVIQS